MAHRGRAGAPRSYATASPAERRVAMQWAARANEAYRQLRDPMLRARYLCEQAGVDLQTESNTSMDPAFLMQQMSWREALDDARGDAAALASLQAELQEARGQMRARLAQLLDGQGLRGGGAESAGMDVRGEAGAGAGPRATGGIVQGAGRPPPNLRAGLRPLSRKHNHGFIADFRAWRVASRRTSASWRWASTLAPPPAGRRRAQQRGRSPARRARPCAAAFGGALFPGGRVTTGREPLAEQALDPLNTVVSVKRHMGRTLEEARPRARRMNSWTRPAWCASARCRAT